MLVIENTICPSREQWMAVIRGMRNPLNSWEKSDTENHEFDDEFFVGQNDLKLMTSLGKEGSCCRKYLRMMIIYADVTAPLYWWKEFDTYKVGTVANSCSTMHKIQDKEFVLDDFSHDHFDNIWLYEPEVRDMAPTIEFSTRTDTQTDYVLGPDDVFAMTIKMLNRCRELYLITKEKKYWWQMIQLLPSSYNQKRTVMLNYETLSQIYKWRKNHKLDEWHTFCDWILTLPYPELIQEAGGCP